MHKFKTIQENRVRGTSNTKHTLVCNCKLINMKMSVLLLTGISTFMVEIREGVLMAVCAW